MLWCDIFYRHHTSSVRLIMSKKLKDGVYKAQNGNDKIIYFVHDGLIGMQWKYGVFKTTTNFMIGAKWEKPLPMSAGEFMKTYNKLEQW